MIPCLLQCARGSRVVLLTLSFATLMIGCATEKAYNKYINKHPGEFAKKCADSFPVVYKLDTVYYEPDSAAYWTAYEELLRFADSLINNPHIDTVNKRDTLIKVISEKVKRTIKPDTVKVLVYKAPDSARLKEYMLYNKRLNEQLLTANVTLDLQDKEIKQFKSDKKNIKIVTTWLLLAFASKWWFWVLFVFLMLYVTRRLWVNFLPPGLSFIAKLLK